MARCCLLLVVAQFAVGVAADDAIAPRLPNPDVAFLLTGDRGTVRPISIAVEVDGRPLADIWNDAFDALFAFHDRNGDGLLSLDEARALPAPFALRRSLWNPVSQFAQPLASPQDIDTNGDKDVSRGETAAFYRAHGVGVASVGAGRSANSKDLTSSLLELLDRNGDQDVSPAEWKNARSALSVLDINNDELITPDELVPRSAYPGTQGAHRWIANHENIRQHAVIEAMPLRLLSHSNVATDHTPTVETENAVQLISVRLPVPASAGATIITADNIRVFIRIDDGTLVGQIQATAKRLRDRFQSADADGNGSLDTAETANKNQSDLRALMEIADRNTDTLLSTDELAAWITLETKLAAGHVLVTVVDFRRGLFEWLDVDEDGRLSLREIADAANRIKLIEQQERDHFYGDALPQQIRVIVSRGRPRTLLAPANYSAPDWFRAMDRNHDGDVSPAEFVGNQSVFQKLDRDRDGLISAGEALHD